MSLNARPYSTPNFAEREFTHAGSEYQNPPESVIRSKLPALMLLCQLLRDLAGVPGVVASWFRTPAHNDAIGGVDHSQHMTGEAADVTFSLVPLRILAGRALERIRRGSFPAFGQLIFYGDKGHVHVSTGTKREVLFSPGLDAKGARIYRRLTDADVQMPLLSKPQARLFLLPRSR